MNKILLSGLAGLAVINAAVAVPSPADRRALCEKHPDKYVWVEKTEACVPINPCESENEDIRYSYCNNGAMPTLPYDSSKRNMILDKYIHNMLGTTISDIIEVSDTVVGVKTQDGRYIAFPSGSKVNQSDCMLNLMYAVSIYGYDHTEIHQMDAPNKLILRNAVSSHETMTDIADFASLLQDDIIRYSGVAEDGVWTGSSFTCPDK